MAVIKKGIRIFREMIRKIVFRIKLREMDNMWYYTGAGCWQLFPPSFYYTHTEEEIERIKKETIERLQQMIDEM
ncbi:hypothetical protein AALB53_17520 [Lachnospiraceae bacterium 47-T17]